MAFLKIATLVFPVSMCLGLGLYAELFCLVLLEGCSDDEEKESFQLKSPKALRVLMLFCRKKAISQIFSCVQYIAKFLTSMQFQFYLNIIGKGEAFLGLLRRI